MEQRLRFLLSTEGSGKKLKNKKNGCVMLFIICGKIFRCLGKEMRKVFKDNNGKKKEHGLFTG